MRAARWVLGELWALVGFLSLALLPLALALVAAIQIGKAF